MEIVQTEDRVAIDFETSSSIKDVEFLFGLSTTSFPVKVQLREVGYNSIS